MRNIGIYIECMFLHAIEVQDLVVLLCEENETPKEGTKTFAYLDHRVKTNINLLVIV